MTLTPVASVQELEQKIAEVEAQDSEEALLNVLSQYYLDLDGVGDFPADPFSEGYRDWVLQLYRRLSKRPGYDPRINELSPFASKLNAQIVSPYNSHESGLVGEMLICYGFIIRTLNLKPGSRVLEYGPGSGQLVINLARVGMRASTIDVDPGYVRCIREQCRALGLSVRAKQGQFGETIEPGERYDAVLFFEAFHHALEHIDLLARLDEVVADDGVIVFAGEPVVSATGHWAPTVPFPWGPRLDLLSVRATRRLGWMELGFQETYFLRLLLRSGWVVRKHFCSLTDRGTMYVARKNRGQAAPGETLLPEDEESTWHPPEGRSRWTRGRSVMTLDARPRWSSARVSVSNHAPFPMPVLVSAGGDVARLRLGPGESSRVQVALPQRDRALEIWSQTFCPRELGMSGDDRTLGVFVGDVEYA
jgi:SAM-dependent methyltransferase